MRRRFGVFSQHPVRDWRADKKSLENVMFSRLFFLAGRTEKYPCSAFAHWTTASSSRKKQSCRLTGCYYISTSYPSYATSMPWGFIRATSSCCEVCRVLAMWLIQNLPTYFSSAVFISITIFKLLCSKIR